MNDSPDGKQNWNDCSYPPVEEEKSEKQKKVTPSPLTQNQLKKQGTQTYNKMKEYYLSPIQDIMD